MKNITQERYLLAFDWLPLEKWDADTILNQEGTPPSAGRLCKVCDKRIPLSKSDAHVKNHVREMIYWKALRRAEAKEAARLRREEKKNANKND